MARAPRCSSAAADAPALTATWGSRGNDEALFAPGVGSVDEAGAPRPSYLTMDGRAVFRFATEVLPKCTSEVLQAAGVDASDVDRFVFHQANKRIVDVAVRKLGLDPARCAGNIDHTGNTSAASVPILLDELVRTGALATPARVVMAGFGAGLTWASCPGRGRLVVNASFWDGVIVSHPTHMTQNNPVPKMSHRKEPIAR